MISFGRRRRSAGQDRLVWHAAGLLLAYPDSGQGERLAVVGDILGHLPSAPREQLTLTHRFLRDSEEFTAAAQYVETFDLKRRSTLYLTYWTAGDTRNRGREILAIADAYRAAGVDPPKSESADHLTVVLEFAALVDPDTGAKLLSAHRVPLDMIRSSLTDVDSPYAPVLRAVCNTLPPASDNDMRRAQQLAASGPPAESVGLPLFTLTVPPRREGVT
ncbi:nitrate reductase molybdenum cofactor assembly chaperone [Rhodococcus sp. AD45-ID]|uniref:nitrate reductase molybdenum cofactor assembly chaperone n=1 Tax=unclassified Rhodococcus (in: high G+C Gram-positive bacteria) TaxID=192944 RepID=UPI0005D38917|nr:MULTISPECIES: nitrate reductase molybdenum cofactor assembly chaperone [unclassified Rhodococcus (in: high G+C Gram-positive bacteria)]KJF22592.1 Nitrate reductase-like protein narX [Rhodococcus sp. AD45]NRI64394.1 nitrate reductase molybdenum cofactor assembly chaperone [Rhodococcus sp. MS16]PSR40193.1 nitrate reductase molybdenum cofactor assembly chaperone [Rhodococcus sp. AD45-ID]